MKARGRGKGMSPVAAFSLLGLGAAVFLWNVMPMLSGGRGRPADIFSAIVGDSGSGQRLEELGDLLAAFGSYEKGTPIRHAFGTSEPDPPAAPLAEPSAAAPSRGGEPPKLSISFLMVGEGLARAVVGGEVVGVGDRIAGGRVVAIGRSGLRLEFEGRILDYTMDSEWPLQHQEAEGAVRGTHDKGKGT